MHRTSFHQPNVAIPFWVIFPFLSLSLQAVAFHLPRLKMQRRFFYGENKLNHICILLILTMHMMHTRLRWSWVAWPHPRENTCICQVLTSNTFSSVQLLSHVWLLVTPWTVAHQASLSITNSWTWFKLMSIESVMPSNHLILCHPLPLPPSIFPNIRVFSSGSVLCIRWPKYWSFSFSISPSNEYSALISFRIDWFALLAVQGV